MPEQQQGVERRKLELHQDAPTDERRSSPILQPPHPHTDRTQHGLHLNCRRSSGLSFLVSLTTSPLLPPQVSTPDGSKFDVIFVGTSSGQLLKVVNSLAPKSIATTRTVIIEEIEVASFIVIQMTIIFWQVAPQLLIKGVTVVRTAKGSGHVLVTTADQVASLTIKINYCVLVGKKTYFTLILQIRSFPLFRCDKARSCGQCVALQVNTNQQKQQI